MEEPPRTPPTDAFGEGSGDPFDDLYAGTEDPQQPPEDWSTRYGNGNAPPPPPRPAFDPSLLFTLLEGLRKAAPPELQERITALIREVLLTLRSLIDWYLERLDASPPEPEVEDIPID